MFWADKHGPLPCYASEHPFQSRGRMGAEANRPGGCRLSFAGKPKKNYPLQISHLQGINLVFCGPDRKGNPISCN